MASLQRHHAPNKLSKEDCFYKQVIRYNNSLCDKYQGVLQNNKKIINDSIDAKRFGNEYLMKMEEPTSTTMAKVSRSRLEPVDQRIRSQGSPKESFIRVTDYVNSYPMETVEIRSPKNNDEIFKVRNPRIQTLGHNGNGITATGNTVKTKSVDIRKRSLREMAAQLVS